ncbi:MAG: AgmX/PglI C-terminal domain-containing protein [Polyangiaceae bacterium]
MAHVHPEFRSDSPHSAPPFGFASAQEPPRLYEADEPDALTHVLLRQTALEPGEFERPEAEAIEVMGFWGSTILFARHLSAAQKFVIGEGSLAEPVDFEVSAAELGVLNARLVDVHGGIAHVHIPEGARANLKQRGEHGFTPTHVASVALLTGTVVELQFGRLKFRIANVQAAKATPRAGLRTADRSVLSAFGLSFGVAAALLASFAFWMPAMGPGDDDNLDQDRLIEMKRYLTAQAERNRDEEKEKADSGLKNADPGAPKEAAQGREGALGKLNAPLTNRRAAARGDSSNTELSRSQQVEAAKSFGMIELLGSLSTSMGSSSPFARNEALGHDDQDAEGNMFGDTIGESGGNGLRLSGLDNGGGGHGLGVGMGGIGTCGTGNCGPAGDGFARGVGRTGPGHVTKGPSIRPNGVSTVSGRLPPEVVRRIVRQNYGRFRMCYEHGLRGNPNLTGRVAVRFVIGREGSVSNAANGGSDMPDSGVVSCVVQAFYGLSFPTPENGIVSVTYPIMFSPG